uniref:Small subunit processome component 20 homolog n=1 Tax=Rhizophora mucronata TaxID=61149 RepID=A0A2P2MER9_RHIMU
MNQDLPPLEASVLCLAAIQSIPFQLSFPSSSHYPNASKEIFSPSAEYLLLSKIFHYLLPSIHALHHDSDPLRQELEQKIQQKRAVSYKHYSSKLTLPRTYHIYNLTK